MASTDQASPTSTQPCERPAPQGRTLLLLLLAFIAGIILTDRFSNRHGQPTTGFLRAETRLIKARQDGTVKALLVRRDKTIHALTPVVQLENRRLRAQIIDAQQEVNRRTAELQQTRAMAEVDLSWRLKDLESETLDTQLKSTSLLQSKHSLDMENVAWQDFIEKFDGLTSRDESEDLLKSLIYPSSLSADESRVRAILRQEAARNAIEVNKARIELCESRIQELKTLKSQLPNRVKTAIGIEVGQTRLNQATATLKRLEKQASALTMTTPVYGTVGAFLKNVDDSVSVGEPLVEIIDEDRLYVEIGIPSRRLPEFPVGTDVALRFPDDEKRTGTVAEISNQLQLVENAAADVQEDSIAKLRIEPSGELWPKTHIGSAIEVVIGE